MSARLKTILLVVLTVGVIAILIAVPRDDNNAVASQGETTPTSTDPNAATPKSATPQIVDLVDQRLSKKSSGQSTPVPRAAGKPKVHVVKDNDTLWQISEVYFGHGKYWQAIAKANPRLVSKSGRIKKGARLIIPHRAQ